MKRRIDLPYMSTMEVIKRSRVVKESPTTSVAVPELSSGSQTYALASLATGHHGVVKLPPANVGILTGRRARGPLIQDRTENSVAPRTGNRASPEGRVDTKKRRDCRAEAFCNAAVCLLKL